MPDGSSTADEEADAGPDGIPAAYEALEARASEHLTTDQFDYVAVGAGGEDTVRENRAAFRRWRIVPRVLRDVRDRDPSIELLGESIPIPLLLAPVANQALLHGEGELATAKAARSHGIPMMVPTGASRTIEAVAETLGDTPRWLQVHGTTDRDLLGSFFRRAEDSGYRGVVLTVDTPTMGFRERFVGRSYDPRVEVGADAIANYLSDPVFRTHLPDPESPDFDTAMETVRALGKAARPATWETLDEILDRTDLPVVLKGIVHPDDAGRAADHSGIDGIVVSTHGGRQVDGAIAALDTLPPVVDAVAGRIPVLFDSGIRRGSDVFKALGLGADAVLLGRPYLYGLAIDGMRGVAGVIEHVRESLDRTMALTGCPTAESIDRGVLDPRPDPA